MNLRLDLGCIGKLESIANVTGKDLGAMTRQLMERMVRFHQEAHSTGGR